ncbi:DUF397 domain-containing protein [Actinomadura sp. 9N215]|uniref:DUF397 domain-containing protein n=1 Tax=Actinomadura sp. 9N215 TaxID=3375150 RepID=UPI0037ABED92
MDMTDAVWRKSSRSSEQGDACVEVASWRKASRSTVQNDNCIEVAGISSAVAVRDSKDPNGPKLIISTNDFQRFANILKHL